MVDARQRSPSVPSGKCVALLPARYVSPQPARVRQQRRENVSVRRRVEVAAEQTHGALPPEMAQHGLKCSPQRSASAWGGGSVDAQITSSVPACSVTPISATARCHARPRAGARRPGAAAAQAAQSGPTRYGPPFTNPHLKRRAWRASPPAALPPYPQIRLRQKDLLAAEDVRASRTAPPSASAAARRHRTARVDGDWEPGIESQSGTGAIIIDSRLPIPDSRLSSLPYFRTAPGR
jgi:hypothetical protein